MAHYVNIIDGMTTCKGEDLNSWASDLVTTPGVVYRAADDYYKVVEDTPASKNVVISDGKAWVRKDYTDLHSQIIQTALTADTEVTIPDNISGNPRIDAICLDVDFGGVPDAEASNLAVITVVQGTPAGSPTAPSNADIQTALGANHGFLRLANVAVASGFVTIVNANITDTRVRIVMTGGQVDTEGIKDDAVTVDQIADNAVEDEQIKNGNVTADKLNADVVSNRIGESSQYAGDNTQRTVTSTNWTAVTGASITITAPATHAVLAIINGSITTWRASAYSYGVRMASSGGTSYGYDATPGGTSQANGGSTSVSTAQVIAAGGTLTVRWELKKLTADANTIYAEEKYINAVVFKNI